MKYITVATDSSPHLDRLISSADYFNIPLTILGKGKSYPNHGIKTKLVLAFLDTVDTNEIVLFLDAYDTVFLCGTEEIEQKYTAMNASIVFSTEQNLKISKGLWVRFKVWWQFPKGKKPYRFLNSGTYIGRCQDLKALWGNMDLSQIELVNSDQTVLNKYFTEHPDALSPDYNHEIFTVTAGRTGLEKEDYSLEKTRLINRITHSRPCILHCPGKNYVGLEFLIKSLPFQSGFYAPSDKEKSSHRRSRINNWLTARTTQDNFLFHLIIDFTMIILLTGLLVAATISIF